jgi:hypothetical protein
LRLDGGCFWKFVVMARQLREFLGLLGKLKGRLRVVCGVTGLRYC